MKAVDPPRQAPCPKCRQPALLGRDNAFRPFCSERCQQLDFSGWVAERYVIAEPALPDTSAEDEPD